MQRIRIPAPGSARFVVAVGTARNAVDLDGACRLYTPGSVPLLDATLTRHTIHGWSIHHHTLFDPPEATAKAVLDLLIRHGDSP
jgi:hypothetical protein